MLCLKRKEGNIFSHVIQGDSLMMRWLVAGHMGLLQPPPPPPPCPYDHFATQRTPPGHVQTCSLGPHPAGTPVGIPLLAKVGFVFLGEEVIISCLREHYDLS